MAKSASTDSRVTGNNWRIATNTVSLRHFYSRAADFGVELYGGTPEARTKALQTRFRQNGPTETIDCRVATNASDVVREVIEKTDPKQPCEDSVDNLPVRLYNALNRSSVHLCFFEVDSLPVDSQEKLLFLLERASECIMEQDTKVGFTTNTADTLSNAHPGISNKVSSWRLKQGAEGSLTSIGRGDIISVSGINGYMEVIGTSHTADGSKSVVCRQLNTLYTISEDSPGATLELSTGKSARRIYDADITVEQQSAAPRKAITGTDSTDLPESVVTGGN
jgi:hypothetical protein